MGAESSRLHFDRKTNLDSSNDLNKLEKIYKTNSFSLQKYFQEIDKNFFFEFEGDLMHISFPRDFEKAFDNNPGPYVVESSDSEDSCLSQSSLDHVSLRDFSERPLSDPNHVLLQFFKHRKSKQDFLLFSVGF